MTGRIVFWLVLWLWSAVSTAVYFKQNRRTRLGNVGSKVLIRALLSALVFGFTSFVWFCWFAGG